MRPEFEDAILCLGETLDPLQTTQEVLNESEKFVLRLIYGNYALADHLIETSRELLSRHPSEMYPDDPEHQKLVILFSVYVCLDTFFTEIGKPLSK